jgi:hypothetical protein
MVNYKPVTTQTSISPRTSDLTMGEQLQWFEDQRTVLFDSDNPSLKTTQLETQS